ncbi:hypothetical protein ACJ73_05217 [Blastomyces percursus]|uniref:Uncharacterized protein n=1 Tax=Blastomyces percursus TaxID=1658174 RepID=A0A1J9Q4J2_9EURO|nr:hypothetical protein ACJ73_05217 [Blastomyces percursus]
MASLPGASSKAAEKQWHADANRLGVSNISIYDVETYKSASKIEEKQFLALRALWVRVMREEFDPEQWGIVKIENMIGLLNGLPFWEDYVNEIKSSPSGPSLPVPHLGAFSFVWYYQQLVQGLIGSDPEPKIDFSPIALRTRSKRRGAGALEQNLQTPSRPSRVQYSPLPDPDTVMEDVSFELQKTLHTSPLADVVSTPESAHSEYIEDSKFSRLQDEQIVNTALISFASVLTYSIQGVNGHWSLQRKAFTFGEGGSKLYEARTDGHLFSSTNPQTSKAIVETKKQLRDEIPDVRRQEAAQMAAWIFSEPTEHQIVSRPSWNGYRRYMISQDRHMIYLIVAEYNSDYITYLRDPEYNLTRSFMTMFECGPWDVSVKNHMVDLGAILLAMTLQLT